MTKKKIILISLILIFVCFKTKAADSLFIKVHFLYGSKPKKGFKKTEVKFFGGLHGGHVSIEIDKLDYGFEPTYRVHVFPHKKKKMADFVVKEVDTSFSRYPPDYKLTSFIIPLSTEQYASLKNILIKYDKYTPYDYAFFGMRCASTTHDILAQIGLLKKKNKVAYIFSTFYPKKLRKRMFKLAKEKNYTVVKQEGKLSRRWEKD